MKADSPQAPRRVLIVDDNRDSASMLALLLRNHGHWVEEAYDGAAALKIAAEFGPDIVFLDLVMPVMDGFAVAEKLREREAGTSRRAQIVALSGFGHSSYREATAEEGFDGHLQKPFAPSELLRIVGGETAAEVRTAESPRPAPASAPDPEAHAAQWQRQLANARATWSELSDEELLASGGQPGPLADMVQKRYAISRNSADTQVEGFLRRHRIVPWTART